MKFIFCKQISNFSYKFIPLILVDYVNKKSESERWKKGETWKLPKRGGSMVQGQACICVCVCGGGGGEGRGWLQLNLFSFSSRFINFMFRDYFTFAKLCYAFEKILFFSATIILCKKVTWVCLKMNLLISHKLRYPICKGVYNIKNWFLIYVK